MSRAWRIGRWLGVVPGVLISLLVVWVAVAALVYPVEYVRRVLLWRESDVGDYLHHFPSRGLTASDRTVRFRSSEDQAVVDVLAEELGASSLDEMLTETDTQGLVVIRDDVVVFERYYNGWDRDSLVTSFSVAKSFVSTLVGIAVEDGHIGSIDDAITDYLPELTERDARFEAIRIRDLLTMSSGLEYEEMRWALFNGDDPLTTYYPDQRELCLTHPDISERPGTVFRYNKCHPQLLGMILERTTSRSVTEYTQAVLWDPLGMELDGSWSLDSEESGFEKLEAGLNARIIDYAKLGRLLLREGDWDGQRIVSAEWVALATGLDPAGRAPSFDDREHYGFMWWGWEREDGTVDFAALGDRGQVVFVSPANGIIIARNGEDYGLESSVWVDAFIAASDRLGA